MFAQTRSHTLWWMVFAAVVALIILVLVPMLLATAAASPPPLGTWVGQTEYGQPVTLILGADGGMFLEGTTHEPVTGAWTWEPISDTIATLRCEPADWPNHPTNFYRVDRISTDCIELSNTFFKATLRPMT